ncbi:ATP-dependent helicase [Gregarina niphandrodes]|uniref:ATP-dependent helicase n=1 Tax=Gregarina niphandrodes TaxID=110365 RepID=A0A023B3B0_GRENI|nr:ATP-dependent helicase [Gregarina niphandrodes]EZG55197.1 ATP-dependent helicase [Gregarina niphandrodes]|eukprot:XP_011131724.1 ATP-dependent helicase [Gregarina niphandrodes]
MEKLPIRHHTAQVIEALLQHPLVVLVGETGSGKTTQLPQIVADAPELCAWKRALTRDRPGPGSSPGEPPDIRRPDRLRVVCVQPHRVAAISVAKRVAEERGCALGTDVGYAVRWDRLISEATYIKYCTDGVLLRECLDGRRGFEAYDVVVLDEAHERSLNMDLLTALAKRLLTRKFGRRRAQDVPVRFVVTSATLNVDKITQFFDNPPVIHVAGRSYPVTIRHVPINVVHPDPDTGDGRDDLIESRKGERGLDEKGGRKRRRLGHEGVDWLSPGAAVSASVALACRIHAGTAVSTGHILCFLSGANECDRAVAETRAMLENMADAGGDGGSEIGSAAVIPLYGTLDARQQANVFVEVPGNCRKIVFATNIAETSLTIDGVGHVIDSGTVKQTRFEPGTGVVNLDRVPISRAQATQRAGRAGRTRAGHCWRLYSEEQYGQMAPEPLPEILRADPSAAVLFLLAVGVRNILQFEFLDAPDRRQLALGLRDLVLLGALAPGLRVTTLGRALMQLPLEPTLARTLIAALTYDVVPEVAAVVAMLSAGQVIIPPATNVKRTHLRRSHTTGRSHTTERSTHTYESHDRSGSEHDRSGSEHEPESEGEESASSMSDVSVSEDTPYTILARTMRSLRDDGGDHLTYLRIFTEYSLHASGKDASDWCANHCVSSRTMAAAARIHLQLLEAMIDVEQIMLHGGTSHHEAHPVSVRAAHPVCERVTIPAANGDSTGDHFAQDSRRERHSDVSHSGGLLMEGVHRLKKRERVLLSLCAGMFLSAAKLVRSSGSGSVRGWASAREGLLLRPASESVLGVFVFSPGGDRPPVRVDAPEWIIASCVSSTSTQGNALVRCASAVHYEWIRDLLARLRDVSLLDCLSGLERTHNDQDSWRDERDVKIETLLRPSKPHQPEIKQGEEERKAQESATQQRDKKVQAAQERLALRRQQQKTNKAER